MNVNVRGESVTASYAVIVLCDHYNIPTTGHGGWATCRPQYSRLSNTDLMYYENFSVSYMEGHKSRTEDLQQLPYIDMSSGESVSTVRSLAAGSLQPVYTSSSLRRYKTSHSWLHMKAGNIHIVAYNSLPESPTFCAVHTSCLPSQCTLNEDIKWLHVILDNASGHLCDGFSSCVVW